MKQTLKTVIISFLVSFNVCVWREAIGVVFDIVTVVILGIALGILLYGFVYDRKRR